METRISLGITVPEETGIGEVVLYVSKWNGVDLLYTTVAYREHMASRHFEVDDSVYPYAIAAVRDAADRAVAAMMEKFARGETLLMHQAYGHQKI